MVNYAKEELKFLNSFIHPRAIRMHFDSHSELDLCPTGWLKKTWWLLYSVISVTQILPVSKHGPSTLENFLSHMNAM